jgi:telomerase protein component 1
MTSAWKTVRVFISSTFLDMQAERDHLVRFVFPRLRSELLKRRIHLVDVDLRWGVTSDQDASEVCREIIDECRPRFICMLGARYGSTPQGGGRSITEDEIHYAVLDRMGLQGYAFFYFRSPEATVSMVEDRPGEFREPAGSPNAIALEEIKKSILENGLNPYVYPAKWDRPNRRLTDLREFGERVYSDILKSVQDEFGEMKEEKSDEFSEENATIDTFIEEQVQQYELGERKKLYDDLMFEFSNERDGGIICLYGDPGSGKSAFLAKLTQEARLSNQYFVISHFVGVSADSTDLRKTLRRFCHELKLEFQIDMNIPEDIDRLRTAFTDFLKMASKKKRIVIIIDAHDEFDETVESMSWLPDPLPENARIVLSISEKSIMDEFNARHIQCERKDLPRLSVNDLIEIVNKYLNRYHKSLSPAQLQSLLTKSEIHYPLYLRVALEELRTLGSFRDIDNRIEKLPDTTEDLFLWLLGRLEEDSGFRDSSGALIGKSIIPKLAGLIVTSRYGMSEQELTDLIEPDGSKGNVPALLRLLNSYIIRRGNLICFGHVQFEKAIRSRYMADPSRQQVMHKDLARYFEERWIKSDRHALEELPYHLVRISETKKLLDLLISLRFVYEKCKAGLTYDLVNDYEQMDNLRMSAMNSEKWREVELFRRFVVSNAGIFHDHPGQVVAFAYNYASGGSVVEKAVEAIEAGWYREPWIELTERPTLPIQPALLKTINPHLNTITFISATRKLDFSVSLDESGIICVWDLTRGQRVRIIRCADGEKADHFAWASEATSLIIITSKGDCQYLQSIYDHSIKKLSVSKIASRAAITSDGKYAAIGCLDGSVHWIDLTSFVHFPMNGGHHSTVSAIALSNDGNTIVSGGEDEVVRIWDTKKRLQTGKVPAHLFGIRSITMDARGDHIFTAEGQSPGSYSDRENIRGMTSRAVVRFANSHGEILLEESPHEIVIQRAGGTTVSGLQGGAVFSVSMTSDGAFGASAGYDGCICVWDLKKMAIVCRIQTHSGCIRGVVVAEDGRSALTAGEDGSIRLWSLAGETPVIPEKPVARLIWGDQSPRRVLFRGHPGLRSSKERKYELVWRNVLIRNRLIQPLWLAAAFGFFLLIFRLFMKIPKSVPLALFCAFLFGTGPFVWSWRARVLRDRSAQHIMDRIGQFRILGFSPFMVLAPFFHVFNCPKCGEAVCGRRNWFFCDRCGFRC